MNKKYDLVVIGAGLSSLMFLNRYLKKFKKHSVLILESKKNIKKDQTFCVWEGPGLDSIQKNFNFLTSLSALFKKKSISNSPRASFKKIQFQILLAHYSKNF